MTLSAQTVQSLTAEVYADLDELHNQLEKIQAAHPEIWESKLVCSCLDCFMSKLNSAKFDSVKNAVTGIKEATEALRALKNAALLALGGV